MKRLGFSRWRIWVHSFQRHLVSFCPIYPPPPFRCVRSSAYSPRALLVGRAHATKSARNVARSKRLGKGTTSRGPKGIGGGIRCSYVMAHIRLKLGLASESPHRLGGRGEARRGGRLRCRSLYHYMEVIMPVPGAEITHHVLVYRYRLFGFVRCRQNWGFGRPVAETIRVQDKRCICLARDVRPVLVPRIEEWPETGWP